MSNGEIIKKLQSHFDTLMQIVPEEEIELWFARDLQDSLGYARWKNFITVILRAITSCKTTGCNPNDHFRDVTKMINLGQGSRASHRRFYAHSLRLLSDVFFLC